jgi:hypothetical protein
MGFALIWLEGLAVALAGLALAAGWAARGRALRGLWVAAVYLVFFTAATALALATFEVYRQHGALVRTSWFFYSLAWLAAFLASGVYLLRRGLRRPGPGLARPAAAWPRGRLWLGFGAAVLALGFTFWNMDLGARADLAIARQEAGALLLAMTPPPVAESENAARVYAEANKDLGEPIEDPWAAAAYRGLDARGPVDWKNPYLVKLMKERETALALLRKAAAMPRCNFDRQRSLLDAVAPFDPKAFDFRTAGTLLALDARVQATQGNLKRAFADVAAILGMVRHLSAELSLVWGGEVMAWRALEDVLRLAPPGEGPLPPLAVPELPGLVRKVRQEHALLGIIGPAVASQPALLAEDERRRHGPWRAWMVEATVVPARVFVVPDELAAMRKLMEDYRKSPRSSRDETPKDWADLRKSVETDPTSIFSVVYIKPKQRVLLAGGAALAALRETARTGLALAAHQRQHGKYPQRLEQLVPDFLRAVPVDPRDGQVLRVKSFPDMLVVYAPQDAERVQSGKLRDPAVWRPLPIFRLPPSSARGKP